MKETDSTWGRRIDNKIKIVVSFNGTFRRRPPAGRLRYTGGESKIISVDQSVSFSRLKARVLELMVQFNGGGAGTPPFSLKYNLPDPQQETPLLPISSDEDVRSMIEEFQRLEFLGKPTRLWVFVSSDDSCFFPEINGFIPHKKILNGKTNGFGKISDNSLRKIVLKQQLLGKKSDRIRPFKSEIGNTEMGFVSEFPVIDISSLSPSAETENLKKVSKDGKLSVGLNYMCDDLLGQISEKGDFGNCSPVAEVSSQDTTASALNVSFKNLSFLSSSTKLQQKISSPSRTDITKCPLNTQSKGMDSVEEEEDLSSDPPFERSTQSSSLKLKDDIMIPADCDLYCTHMSNGGLQVINKSELEYVKELGSGAYGTVYYGKWKGSDVAIKRLKLSCFTDGTVEDRLVAEFWKEAHILGHLHHPNIVALYGVVTDGPMNHLETVTEFMVNGSLKQVLRKRDGTIDCRKRLIIALDAAFGMEYLHQKNVIHFDLKSHNFLVNMRDPHRPVCKIGDLGLSKIKQRTLVSGGVRGTIPWMAPELLNGENMVSEKVDVYSFGIVMWELLTGAEPYSNLRAEEIICGIIKGGLRPEIPNWCHPSWRYLMERCWSSDPKARPTFSDIAKELRAMAWAMNIK